MPILPRPPNHFQVLVDAELIALDKRSFQLKTQRNGYADVSRLPNEILLEIFTILKGVSPLESWFKINLVCRHWRYVAIEAPGIWTDPPTNLHELTVVMLERSKMCDLHVQLDDKTATATTTAILDHVGRIRSLSIHQHSTNLKQTQTLFRSFGGASRLNKLTVVCRGYHPQLAFSAFAIQPLDQLLSLELSTVHFNWGILPIPSLTFLSLSNVTMRVLLPFVTLLETMRSMPWLQKIVLDCEILSISNSSIAPQKTVELLHLSSLELDDVMLGQAEYILSHLTLPQLQYLDINCMDRSTVDNNDDYLSFMRLIMTTLRDGDFGTLDSLTITDHHFQLEPQQEPSIPVGLSLFLPFIYEIEDYSYIIRDTIAGFSPKILASLVRVDVTCTLMPGQLFSSFFESLPVLRSICVGDDLTEALIQSLNIPANHSSATPHITFPKLEEVMFRSATLSRSNLEKLRCHLSIRRTFGAPVSKLTLESCTIMQDSLELLNAADLEVITSDIDFVDEEELW